MYEHLSIIRSMIRPVHFFFCVQTRSPRAAATRAPTPRPTSRPRPTRRPPTPQRRSPPRRPPVGTARPLKTPESSTRARSGTRERPPPPGQPVVPSPPAKPPRRPTAVVPHAFRPSSGRRCTMSSSCLPSPASLPIRLTTSERYGEREKTSGEIQKPTDSMDDPTSTDDKGPKNRKKTYRSGRKVKRTRHGGTRSHREDSYPNRWLARTRAAPTLFII